MTFRCLVEIFIMSGFFIYKNYCVEAIQHYDKNLPKKKPYSMTAIIIILNNINF